MRIIFSKECLNYELSGHPESVNRLRSSYEYLKEKGFKFSSPAPVEEEDILLAHTKEHINSIKFNTFSDPDTPNFKNIFKYACLAAGAAKEAMRMSLNGEKVFSLMRPPGHHASRSLLGGFCYFNNMAIAIKSALRQIKKAAIIDIDVHHGNGTQDIFFVQKNVLFVSLHQVPLYPGTGFKSDKNCLNFPLSPDTDDAVYLKVFELALKKVTEFNPDLIGVSCGFDTYQDDPLASLKLTIPTYTKLAGLISNLRKPFFSVLEGGYSAELKECIFAYIGGLI